MFEVTSDLIHFADNFRQLTAPTSTSYYIILLLVKNLFVALDFVLVMSYLLRKTLLSTSKVLSILQNDVEISKTCFKV